APWRDLWRHARVTALARIAKNSGSLARTEITGRLESGHDGAWRNTVHSKIASMPALSRRSILRRAQAGHRRILTGKTKEACHYGSYAGRCGIRGCKRPNSSVATAQKNKRESLGRSRADAGFKNVAFPRALGQ